MLQKGYLFALFLVCFVAWSSLSAHAEPTPQMLRDTIRAHVMEQQGKQGFFTIKDERRGGAERRLQLVRVHERVGKTGDYYYSCTDMRDIETNELLDLDFDVEDRDGKLSVVAERIHKDNGIPRYTYDADDNMIPLIPATTQPAIQ